MPIFIKKVVFPILCFGSAFLILLKAIGIPNVSKSTSNKTTTYVLKSYKNSVALYNEGELIKVYDDVVLNTLPQKDVQNFNKGISFASLTQAENYLLDFE